MNISRRAAFGFLLVGLIFLSGFLFRDFLLVNFIKPIALALWAFNRVLASIDQAFYWIVFFLSGMVIILVRLAMEPTVQEKIHHPGANATLENIVRWRNLILFTSDEIDKPSFLKRNLLNLLKDIYALKQAETIPWQVFEALEKGIIPMPAPIRAFLLLDPARRANPSLIQRIKRAGQVPMQWVRHWTGQDVADYYQSISDVITLMEHELESEYGDESLNRNNH